jgi:hypothetical protein
MCSSNASKNTALHSRVCHAGSPSGGNQAGAPSGGTQRGHQAGAPSGSTKREHQAGNHAGAHLRHGTLRVQPGRPSCPNCKTLRNTYCSLSLSLLGEHRELTIALAVGGTSSAAVSCPLVPAAGGTKCRPTFSYRSSSSSSTVALSAMMSPARFRTACDEGGNKLSAQGTSGMNSDPRP